MILTKSKSARFVLVTILITGLLFLTVMDDSYSSGNETQSPAKQVISAPINEPSQTTISIAALNDHSLNVALTLLKNSDFEEQTGINVEAVLLEFGPMVRAHELDLVSDEGRYDLVSIDQPFLGHYVTQGWVRPLDEFMADSTLPSLAIEDLVPSLVKACGEWNGRLYAIPMGSYGSLLAYRTDVLSTAGLQPPMSFADFKASAHKVNSPPELYGIALFAHAGEYITADVAPFLWSWGSGLINGSDVNLLDKTMFRAAWDSPEGIAALEFYASIYTEGLTPPDTLEFDHERYIKAFQSGKIAMGIIPAEGVGLPMEDPAVSKVSGKIGYTTLPRRIKTDGSTIPPRAGLGAHSLAINSHSKHPREAYLVLQFLTGKNIGYEYIDKGGRPFRNSHFSKEAIAKFPYLEPIRVGMKTGRYRPNIPEYPAVSKIFYTAFHSALKYGAPVAEVMRAAARKANEEILIPAYPEIVLPKPKRSSVD
jgi:ABC-type glycerol-3-phosphate transport system substrate-binding protein